MNGANSAASLFNIMAVAVVLPSLLGLFNTLLINITERQYEIGMLRAIGAERMQILRMVVAETIVMALLSAIIGTSAGIALGVGFVSLWQNTASRVYGGLYPVIPLTSIVIVIVIGLVVAGIISILPTQRVNRMNVVQILHYE